MASQEARQRAVGRRAAGTLIELRQRAAGLLRDESAALVAWTWAVGEAEEAAGVVPELEKEARAAQAEAEEARGKLATAQQTLQIVAADRARLRERTGPDTRMMTGGIMYADGSMVDVFPASRAALGQDAPTREPPPDPRDVVAADLAVKDARLLVRRLEEALMFLDHRLAQAADHLTLAKGRVRELRELEKPETPTWALFMTLLER